MPRTIILVRHGESEHHVRRLTGGWTDTPLTPRGHQQARLCAARLRDELGGTPVRVISSDLKRASQTAQAIAEALDAPLELDVRLREHNNGEAANLSLEEAQARWPGSFNGGLPLDAPPWPGAESGRAFFERCAAFLNEAFDERPAVAVTHGGSLTRLVGCWLNLPAEQLAEVGFEAHPTGITVLRDTHYMGRTIERLNDVAHLAGEHGRVMLGAIVSGHW